MTNRQRAAALSVIAGLLSPPTNRAADAQSRLCRVGVLEGEAQAGQAFEQSIGNGLKILLEPIASGWILRVLPDQGSRGQHDYAELSTPPYRSVSPLLISTDFSFRAQDALAWNPRNFRFAPDRTSFARLMVAYTEEMRWTNSGASASETSRGAEARLAALVSQMPQAQFSILDARVVQGTADQAQTAAMVASHLSRSAHHVDQPPDGRATPLGKINWLRFRIRLDLPASFRATPALKIEKSACL